MTAPEARQLCNAARDGYAEARVAGLLGLVAGRAAEGRSTLDVDLDPVEADRFVYVVRRLNELGYAVTSRESPPDSKCLHYRVHW